MFKLLGSSLSSSRRRTRRRHLSRAPYAAEIATAAEKLESRLLLSPTIGILSFSATDYGYGSAIGDLTGAITGGSGNWGEYRLEVDIGNDGTIDWTDESPSDVTSIWAEISLPYETTTVAVQLTELEYDTSTSTTGPWTVQDITVDPPANSAPSLTNLTYTPWDLGYGLLGYISGDIVDSTQGLGTYELQVDLNGDGVSDDSFTSEGLNTDVSDFAYTIEPQTGSQTVSLRVREQDVNSGQTLEGDWASLTFSPALPANDAPEITYLEFYDSGYGSMGDLVGEFADFTRDGSSYRIDLDEDGDGVIDWSASPSNDFQFSANGVASGTLARVVETDMFGVESASAWVAATMGVESEAPAFADDATDYTLAKISLTNGQVIGTVTATDPEGDTLRYKLNLPATIVKRFFFGGELPPIVVVKTPRPGVSVDPNTGQIKIADKDVIAAAFTKDYKYEFTVTVSDGKETDTISVILYDDYETYLREIDDHIDSWVSKANELARLTHINVLDALSKLDDFANMEAFVGTTAAITSLTWAATAYAAPALGAPVAIAAVLVQLAINAVAAKVEEGSDAIIEELKDQMEAVRDQDYAKAIATEVAEQAAITQFRGTILNLSPDQQAKKMFEYWQNLKARLPTTEAAMTPPAVNDIYAESLLSYIRVKGWSIKGSEWHYSQFGTYWNTWATDWPGINDVSVISDYFERLVYSKCTKFAINPW